MSEPLRETVDLTIRVTVDVDYLAEQVAALSDDAQAQLLCKVAARLTGTPNGIEMQGFYIGRHLATCECSTDEGRDLVRAIVASLDEHAPGAGRKEGGMSEDELKAIEERAAQATPGPWKVRGCRTGYDACAIVDADGLPIVQDTDRDECTHLAVQDGADAAFIAHAREDVPRLCAEVRRLQGELGKAVELLESVVCGPTPRLVDTDAIREFLAAYHAARRGE